MMFLVLEWSPSLSSALPYVGCIFRDSAVMVAQGPLLLWAGSH